MKTIKNTLLLSLAFVFTIAISQAQTFMLDTEKSSVEWSASKVIGGGHNGVVDLGPGKLVLENGQLKGGSFAADMKTIQVLDLTGSTADKLSGHLFSKDFFGVEEHPVSTFYITDVKKVEANNYMVTGEIRIKGMSETVEFPASLKWANELPVATATVTLDRTKFGIRYGSDSFFNNLGDKAIENEFQIKVTLTGKR